jgi:hypothetical protein
MSFLALIDAATSQSAQVPNLTRSLQREHFNWDLEKQFTLAKIVKRYNGHIKTKDMSMKSKWDLILNNLKARDEFIELKILQGPLAVKFHRDQEKVLEKFQISKEGANLSGLPEQPSPYEHLHISMAEESATKEKKRKRAAEVKYVQKQSIEGITASQLEAQGKIKSQSSCTSDSSPADSNISSLSTYDDNTTSAATFINKLTEKLTATFTNPFEDEDRDLDRKLKRAQIRAAEAQEDYYLCLKNEMHVMK